LPQPRPRALGLRGPMSCRRWRVRCRHVALALVAACAVQGLTAVGRSVIAFVAGTSPGAVSGAKPGAAPLRPGLQPLGGAAATGVLPLVQRWAEPVKEEPEGSGPDISGDLKRIMRNALGTETRITAASRITPIDRWFGWDRGLLAYREADDPFVDSNDAESYLTVLLDKPLGIEFVENTAEEGGGVGIGEVRPGFSGHASGLLEDGYHLVAANDTPVHGFTFEDALKPIIDSEGAVKMTFFKGDPAFFYGEFRPDAVFLENLLEYFKTAEPEQAPKFDEPSIDQLVDDDAQ